MTKKKTILFAGKKQSLEPLAQPFKKAGYGVSIVPGGFDALNEIAEGTPSAVVLDAELEEIKSYQLASLIKSGAKIHNLPVVMLLPDKSSSENGFWSRACQADLSVAFSDAKSNSADFVAKVETLITSIESKGFKPETAKVNWQPLDSKLDAESKYERFIDDLLIERLVGQLIRQLIDVVEPRNQFLENYFRLSGQIFDAEVIGLAVLSSNRPWLTLKAAKSTNKKSLDDLAKNISKQLGGAKDLAVDLQGEIEDSGGAAIKSHELLLIEADKTTLGAVVFASSKPFDGYSKQAMANLQSLIVPVMRLVLASQEIEVLYQKELYRTSTDSATGLYNLEFLVGFLQQQLLFSYRQKSPVGLLIVDVDNLKSINDEFGYQIGDLVLSKLATRLLSMTRASDLIGRYGGDEFAVVMPNSDANGAKVLAEKIRLEVPQMSFNLPGQKKSPKVTVSIGCSGFNMEDLNPETILRDAKHALQRAKSAGGNRVSV